MAKRYIDTTLYNRNLIEKKIWTDDKSMGCRDDVRKDYNIDT